MATILLFDVDGTLVTTGGAGRRAIVRSLERDGVTGSANFSFAGMTDRRIVRRAFEEGGLEASAERIDAFLTNYVEVLREEVAAADNTGSSGA